MNVEQEMELIFNLQNEGGMPNPYSEVFPGDGIKIIYFSTKKILIAHSDLMPNDIHCYLRVLYIKPEHRKQKLGSFIVAQLIQKCLEKNIRSIELESENNSINFFKKLGFKIIDKSCNRMKLSF